MRKFGGVDELINTLRPENPVYCIRPNSIRKSVEFFKNNFPGRTLYAPRKNTFICDSYFPNFGKGRNRKPFCQQI